MTQEQEPRQPWQIQSGAMRSPSLTLHDLFWRYADSKTTPLEQEGLIRGIMTVEGRPAEHERRDLRQQIVAFLCDVAEREHGIRTELVCAARVTLARHVCPSIGTREHLATYEMLATFFGTTYTRGGLYEQEIRKVRACAEVVYRGIRDCISPTGVMPDGTDDPAWTLLVRYSKLLVDLCWFDELCLARALPAIWFLYNTLRHPQYEPGQLPCSWLCFEWYRMRETRAYFESNFGGQYNRALRMIFALSGRRNHKVNYDSDAAKHALLALTAMDVVEREESFARNG